MTKEEALKKEGKHNIGVENKILSGDPTFLVIGDQRKELVSLRLRSKYL